MEIDNVVERVHVKSSLLKLLIHENKEARVARTCAFQANLVGKEENAPGYLLSNSCTAHTA